MAFYFLSGSMILIVARIALRTAFGPIIVVHCKNTACPASILKGSTYGQR
jgi:hypothetical protein